MRGRTRRPVGSITRGTTGHNRLRRADRWIAAAYGGLLRSASRPLVVDLGFGASHVTTTELYLRLRAIRPDVEVLGIEIDPERVAAAAPHARPGLSFAVGGFELLPAARPPLVVRAFNVLRQYGEAESAAAWGLLRSRIAADGVIVEGTCSEVGHRAAWVGLDASGPRTLTLSTRFTGFDRPSDLAERLPKALIHRNVPGEPVHDLFQDLDRAWAVCSPYAAYGVRQRWAATVETLARTWPVLTRPPLGGRARWRLGELTLPWAAVAPGFPQAGAGRAG
ncbi:class I SAM-dependent methyltransferase [Spongiactinospora sp. 9N601]|uniref:class I SAM-dependent methyltransferase n=1 Tax=Spongiactinospora sp. 9N601 TaxID=3375149 RepID=UPI0037887057